MSPCKDVPFSFPYPLPFRPSIPEDTPSPYHSIQIPRTTLNHNEPLTFSHSQVRRGLDLDGRHTMVHPPLLIALATFALTTTTVLVLFPFPTTIPVFLGALAGLATWTAVSWARIALAYARGKEGGAGASPWGGYSRLLIASDDEAEEWEREQPQQQRGGRRRYAVGGPRWALAVCTVLVLSVCCVGLRAPRRTLAGGAFQDSEINPSPSGIESIIRPSRDADAGWTAGRVFIAANLYNVEPIWDVWSAQVLALAEFRESFSP